MGWLIPHDKKHIRLHIYKYLKIITQGCFLPVQHWPSCVMTSHRPSFASNPFTQWVGKGKAWRNIWDGFRKFPSESPMTACNAVAASSLLALWQDEMSLIRQVLTAQTMYFWVNNGPGKGGAPASDLGEPKPACCLQTMPWASSKTFSRYQVSWFVNINVYYREPVDSQGPDHPRHGHPITCCHQHHVASIVNTDDPQVALGNRHRLCVTSGLQRALGDSGGGGGVNAAATMTTVCRFPKTLNTQLHMTRQFHAYIYTQRGWKHVCTSSYTQMFVTALFILPKGGNSPN